MPELTKLVVPIYRMQEYALPLLLNVPSYPHYVKSPLPKDQPRRVLARV